MSGVFNTTALAGHRVLVTGTTETEKTILNSEEWDDIKAHTTFHQVDAEFEAQVEAFFAPLVAAGAAAEAKMKALSTVSDPAFSITLGDEVEAVEGSKAETIVLGRDAAILKMLEAGDTSRLVWVGSTIEITAYVPTPVVDETVLANADDLR